MDVLIDTDIEVHHNLHVQGSGIAGGGDVAQKHVVGDGHSTVVESLKFDRAKAYGDDVAVIAAEFHPISELEGPVEHDGNPGHE
jgi:hypothetical protein